MHFSILFLSHMNTARLVLILQARNKSFCLEKCSAGCWMTLHEQCSYSWYGGLTFFVYFSSDNCNSKHLLIYNISYYYPGWLIVWILFASNSWKKHWEWLFSKCSMQAKSVDCKVSSIIITLGQTKVDMHLVRKLKMSSLVMIFQISEWFL